MFHSPTLIHTKNKTILYCMKYDEQCAIHPSFIHSHSFTPMASVELPVNLLNCGKLIF